MLLSYAMQPDGDVPVREDIVIPKIRDAVDCPCSKAEVRPYKQKGNYWLDVAPYAPKIRPVSFNGFSRAPT